jgi:TolA-binding protein
MAYDPNFPPDHQALAAAPWRDQFNGLKALIDAQQATIDSQQSQIGSMNSSIAELQDAVNALQGNA